MVSFVFPIKVFINVFHETGGNSESVNGLFFMLMKTLFSRALFKKKFR